MIDFDQKTYKDILSHMMKRVPDTIDKREGSMIQTALGPAGWYLEGVYLDLKFFLDNVFADTATGAYLDQIATLLNIKRKEATHAVKEGMFDQKIPIGSRFSILDRNGQYITYKAIEYMETINGTHNYKMQCEVPGEAGNSYIGPLIPIDYMPGLTKAQLTTTLIAGAETETDEALRRRLLAHARAPSTSGNIYDYYNWAMECAGVGAAKIFPLASGPGTVKVVIADANIATAGTDLINDVKEHIEELRPIGADVTVASVKEKTVDVSARIKLTAGLNLGAVQSAFRTAFQDYLHKEAFGMSYLSLARVGNLMLETVGVEDYSDLKLNGVAENVALAEEEIAVAGVVTLEVMQQ